MRFWPSLLVNAVTSFYRRTRRRPGGEIQPPRFGQDSKQFGQNCRLVERLYWRLYFSGIKIRANRKFYPPKKQSSPYVYASSSKNLLKCLVRERRKMASCKSELVSLFCNLLHCLCYSDARQRVRRPPPIVKKKHAVFVSVASPCPQRPLRGVHRFIICGVLICISVLAAVSHRGRSGGFCRWSHRESRTFWARHQNALTVVDVQWSTP